MFFEARTVSAKLLHASSTKPHFFTALDEGELLTAVRFSRPPAGHGYCYMKQKRKIGDYATAAAAVMLVMTGGTCSKAAIALTNVGDTPLYAQAAVDALVNTTVDASAIETAVNAAKSIANPAEDGRGPGGFSHSCRRRNGAACD